MRYRSSGETGRSGLCPHKARKVRNVFVTGDLHENGSLPDPLEDHDTTIPNKAARHEVPIIWSAELHPPDLV